MNPLNALSGKQQSMRDLYPVPENIGTVCITSPIPIDGRRPNLGKAFSMRNLIGESTQSKFGIDYLKLSDNGDPKLNPLQRSISTRSIS